MNNSDVHLRVKQCREELDEVRDAIDRAGPASTVAPFLTNYAVVRACGTIEASFKAVVADVCSRKAAKQIKRFVGLKITKSSANPSYSRVLGMLKEFDEGWNKALKDKLHADPDRQRLIDSLQSLVDARNTFAHGGSPTITIADVISYYDCGTRVVEYVDMIVV